MHITMDDNDYMRGFLHVPAEVLLSDYCVRLSLSRMIDYSLYLLQCTGEIQGVSPAIAESQQFVRH